MALNIGGVGIGGDNPCRFVAELSNNANGDLARCLRLITAAKDAGASIIKLQAYKPWELVHLRGDGPATEPWGSQGWSMAKLYEKAATPFEWFPVIKQYCEDLEIPWFSSVFGPESLDMLEANDCPAWKVARLDNAHPELLKLFRSGRGLRPVLISTDRLDWDGGPKGLPNWAHALWCPPNYPTERRDVCLPMFVEREADCDGAWEEVTKFIGLSSHCLDPRLPIAAVARGAKLLEYHFQLAEEPSELESNISLDQYAFARMVDDVRAVEEML